MEKVMLKSCSYCGKIHDSKLICNEKQTAINKRNIRRKSASYGFHRSGLWTEKSIDIRKRDNNLCLCCKAKLQGTSRQFNAAELSVHHIDPIEEDYDRRLDESNLITVCRLHHELCEKGTISREVQRCLVKETMKAAGHDGDAPMVL